MKLLGKIVASLLVTAACLYYAIHGVAWGAVVDELRALPAAGVALYLFTLALTHLFRAWRWEYLLRPVGASVPLRRLLPISAVGFMAVLALPFRIGELVRPYLAAREGRVRMSAAVGTVAVERTIDGLVISILFFVSYRVSAGGVTSRELGMAAWLSLLGFLGLTAFLALALARTEATIRVLTPLMRGLAQLVPLSVFRRAREDKLRSLISGFRVLSDRRNLTLFLGQTVAYWGCNGVGMWLLARAMGLPISVGAAFTAMAFTGVVLTLPNAPGLVGQFHAGIKLALMAYLPAAVVNSKGIAYAVVLHGLQTVWYVGLGLIALAFVSAGRGSGSLREAIRESSRAAEAAEAEPT